MASFANRWLLKQEVFREKFLQKFNLKISTVYWHKKLARQMLTNTRVINPGVLVLSF
jgi:hypothetical protein